MASLALAALAVLAAAAGAGGEVDLDLSAAAGAGHDANVSHDAAAGAAVSSDLALVSATVGADRAWDAWWLGGAVVADAIEVLDVTDLSERRAGAELALGASPRERVAVTGTVRATRSWWGDSARDGWALGGTATVRLRVRPRLALVGSYGRTWYEADDPVYTYSADRVAARAEVRLGRRTYLRAGYALSWRDEVFYEPLGETVAASRGGAGAETAAERAAVAAEGPGPGEPPDGSGAGADGSGGGTRRGPDGRPITSSFPDGDRLVVRSDARTRTARAGVEVALFSRVYLDVDVSYLTVSADAGEYDTWVAVALLGYRR